LAGPAADEGWGRLRAARRALDRRAHAYRRHTHRPQLVRRAHAMPLPAHAMRLPCAYHCRQNYPALAHPYPYCRPINNQLATPARTRLTPQAHAVHFEPAHALVPLDCVAATARDATPRTSRAPASLRGLAARPLAKWHLRQPQAGAHIYAMHRPCIGRACAVHTRARAHVACACACACARARSGMWHVACGMCICAYVHVLHAWLQVGVGKHQRLHDGDLVEVFNRDLLRHRTVSPPTHPSPTPYPPLTQTLTLIRTCRSPTASTITRASRTMSTRDKLARAVDRPCRCRVRGGR